MHILIIALQSDLHADAVIYHLNKKGIEVFRTDPTIDKDIPEEILMTSVPAFNVNYKFQNGKELNPLECNGIYCRFAIDSLISTSDDPLVNFSSSESLSAFLAPLRMIESSRWINDPWIENRVDCKLLQTKIAQTIGLNIPEFIVSSDYNDLLSFYNEYNNVIIKPLSDTVLALVDNKFVKQENIFTDNFNAPYTAKFKPIDNFDIKNVDKTPTLLQREINKKSDIRVTVIDNKLYAVEMPYEEGNPIDFRLNKLDNVRKYILPNNIIDKLIELVNILGLRFASCDLVLDMDNNLYFLEANVQGNWLWTETKTEFKISETIANALIYGKK